MVSAHARMTTNYYANVFALTGDRGEGVSMTFGKPVGCLLLGFLHNECLDWGRAEQR